MIFSHWSGSVSVRTQAHRLDAAGRLYDMTKDPGQRHDIAKDEPETAARLSAAVARWKRDVLAGLKKDRPFPVGDRQFPRTPPSSVEPFRPLMPPFQRQLLGPLSLK